MDNLFLFTCLSSSLVAGTAFAAPINESATLIPVKTLEKISEDYGNLLSGTGEGTAQSKFSYVFSTGQANSFSLLDVVASYKCEDSVPKSALVKFHPRFSYELRGPRGIIPLALNKTVSIDENSSYFLNIRVSSECKTNVKISLNPLAWLDTSASERSAKATVAYNCEYRTGVYNAPPRRMLVLLDALPASVLGADSLNLGKGSYSAQNLEVYVNHRNQFCGRPIDVKSIGQPDTPNWYSGNGVPPETAALSPLSPFNSGQIPVTDAKGSVSLMGNTPYHFDMVEEGDANSVNVYCYFARDNHDYSRYGSNCTLATIDASLFDGVLSAQ